MKKGDWKAKFWDEIYGQESSKACWIDWKIINLNKLLKMIAGLAGKDSVWIFGDSMSKKRDKNWLD